MTPEPDGDAFDIQPGFAAALRRVTDAALQEFESRGGVGPDAYCADDVYHAMAEAKYLLAVDEMTRSGLISADVASKKFVASVARLTDGAVSSDPSSTAWGLRFAHGMGAPDEPYIVTTALVVLALDRARSTGVEHPQAAELIARGRNWLLDGIRRRRAPLLTPDLPQFSPHTDTIVTNAVALWSAALNGEPAARKTARRAARWVESQYRQEGWPYSRGNARVDLLHQCYIINALGEVRGFGEVERRATQTLSNFLSHDRLLDKFDITTPSDAIARVSSHGRLLPSFRGRVAVVSHPERARLWSYGEFLVTCAQMQRLGSEREYWARIAARFATEALDGIDITAAGQTVGLRQTMHLAHGTASLLRNLREQTAASPARQ